MYGWTLGPRTLDPSLSQASLSYPFVYKVSHISSIRIPVVLVISAHWDKSVGSTMLPRPVPHIVSPTDGWPLWILWDPLL